MEPLPEATLEDIRLHPETLESKPVVAEQLSEEEQFVRSLDISPAQMKEVRRLVKELKDPKVKIRDILAYQESIAALVGSVEYVQDLALQKFERTVAEGNVYDNGNWTEVARVFGVDDSYFAQEKFNQYRANRWLERVEKGEGLDTAQHVGKDMWGNELDEEAREKRQREEAFQYGDFEDIRPLLDEGMLKAAALRGVVKDTIDTSYRSDPEENKRNIAAYKQEFAIADEDIQKAVINDIRNNRISNIKELSGLRAQYPYIDDFLTSDDAKKAARAYIDDNLVKNPTFYGTDIMQAYGIAPEEVASDSLQQLQRVNMMKAIQHSLSSQYSNNTLYKLQEASKVFAPEDWQALFDEYGTSDMFVAKIVEGIGGSYDLAEKVSFLNSVGAPEETVKKIGSRLIELSFANSNSSMLGNIPLVLENIEYTSEEVLDLYTLGIVAMVERGRNTYDIKKAMEQVGIAAFADSPAVQEKLKDAYLKNIEKGNADLLRFVDGTFDVAWDPEDKAARKQAVKTFLTDSYVAGTLSANELKNFVDTYYPETHKIYLFVDPAVRGSMEKILMDIAFQSHSYVQKDRKYVQEIERYFLLSQEEVDKKITDRIEGGKFVSEYYGKMNMKNHFPEIDIQKANEKCLELHGIELVEKAFESSDWDKLRAYAEGGNEDVVAAIDVMIARQEAIVNDDSKSMEQRVYAFRAILAMTDKFDALSESGILSKEENIQELVRQVPLDLKRVSEIAAVLPKKLLTDNWPIVYGALRDASPDELERHAAMMSGFSEDIVIANWQTIYDGLKGLEGSEYAKQYERMQHIANAISLGKFRQVYEKIGGMSDQDFEKHSEIMARFDSHFFSSNWEFVYDTLKDLEGDTLEKEAGLLVNIQQSRGSYWFKLQDVKKVYSDMQRYTSEQQEQLFALAEQFTHPIAEFANEDWPVLLLQYVDITEEHNAGRYAAEYKERIKQLFSETSPYREVVLEGMQKEWQAFLGQEQQDTMPAVLYLACQLISDAGGAGNLKHVEALSGLLRRFDEMQKGKKTAGRSAKEIDSLLLAQEQRMGKDGWSLDDRSEFYNLSADIMAAAPSLYAAFSPVIEKLSAKEMKTFSKELLPLYQAELVTIQSIDSDGGAEYSPRELVGVRQGVEALAASLTEKADQRKTALGDEKERLVAVIKEGFKERFGILKVPEEFSKEHIRAVQNGVRYIGNINGRTPEREATVAFYLALELNEQWGAFRQGKEIDAAEYIGNDQLQRIKPLLEQKKASMALPLEVAGIAPEQGTRFQELLQGEVSSSMVGNIETVDVKLGNIKRNIDELADPDIYESERDKGIVTLLAAEGRNISAVLAKTFAESSGKGIVLTPEEKELQGKLASLFSVSQFTPAEVKRVQDYIQPFSLISNVIAKVQEENVDASIAELQQQLVPNDRIVEIFNRLGEDFTQESGAYALSKDLSYLEGLLVKDDKNITPEEKAVIEEYLTSIRKKMTGLETTLQTVKEYFDKMKKSSHTANNPIIADRLKEIEKVINSTSSSTVIVSRMTKDLNLIIENMRQCLGCLRKEANNDTNLAFGDYNKFFMINQSEKEQGSISDEIIFFVPVNAPDGSSEMSFVMDKVYGSKSSDVLISNIQSVYKKYQSIKKEMPDAKISISVTQDALTSVGLSPLLLQQKLAAMLPDIKAAVPFDHKVADMPKSSFSDNYIEFGAGGARKSGARAFSGVTIK